MVASLAALLVVGGIATTAAFAQGPEGLPERIAAIVRGFLGAQDGRVAATVNGRPITVDRLELEVSLRNAQGINVTRADTLETLISDAVVFNEAERRGIKVSDSELASFVADQKALADADPERQVYRYAAALGLSETTVWTHPPFVQTWREALTYGALKRSVLGTVSQETLAAKEAEWATYLKSLRARAEIRRFE